MIEKTEMGIISACIFGTPNEIGQKYEEIGLGTMGWWYWVYNKFPLCIYVHLRVTLI